MENTDFNILKNRMLNGTPFLKDRAMERIQILVNDLLIGESEATELRTLAENYGCDILPQDAMGRLAHLEVENKELKAMIAKLSGQPMPESEEVPANA